MVDKYVWFEGIPFSKVVHNPEMIREVRDRFVVKDEDTIIVTYPKSGTHWLIEIICLIQSKGDARWVQSVPIWERSPWVETCGGYERVKTFQDPRLYACHLPIHLFPKSFFRTKAKVIYLMRNPKDTLVSGYYFCSATNLYKTPKSMEEFCEWFIQGHVPFGSWFEHIRGWLSMRESDNFLLLFYEDLKKDAKSVVEKICRFLGKNLEPEEVDLVIKNSSFQVMKDNKMSNFSLLPFITNPDFSFIRKGISGNWKNHFTVSQAETFDKIYREKMLGFPQGLFPWE